MKIMKEKIWVQIETNKGTNHVCHYRGLMLLDDLDKWVAGKLKAKCILLEQCYWVEQEDLVQNESGDEYLMPFYRIVGHDIGQYYNFSGDIFLVAEHIVVIYKLKDGSERESFQN